MNKWTASNTWGVISVANCCQGVKQRIAMANEAFNRKRNIFYGLLETELQKRLVKLPTFCGV